MELLEALLTLATRKGKRQLQRTHLYAAVGRVLAHLSDVVRIGDSVQVEARTYSLQRLQKQDGNTAYAIVVDNGRGPAILGDRIYVTPFLPHASYEEHVIAAEGLAGIINAFGDLMAAEVQRSERAEQEAISEDHTLERII